MRLFHASRKKNMRIADNGFTLEDTADKRSSRNITLLQTVQITQILITNYSDLSFADIVHIYKFHLLNYFLTIRNDHLHHLQ